MPSRRSAWASNMTPPSELIRPPSKAAVIFLRRMAGKQNGRRLSSVMAGVARLDPGKGLAKATESYARSKAYATSATPDPPRHEYDGLAPPCRRRPVGIRDPAVQTVAPAVLQSATDAAERGQCGMCAGPGRAAEPEDRQSEQPAGRNPQSLPVLAGVPWLRPTCLQSPTGSIRALRALQASNR